ncbi:Serpentine type 7TM GPCR chemoreceptor Srx family protein [Acanthocheilonema viteae]
MNNDQISMISGLDLSLFVILESLGFVAIFGNVSLITILVKFNYLNRASFILLLSLAFADVLHGIVTTSYFYPPIVLKRQYLPLLWMKIFNAMDWIAWAITLTHISAVCLDRLAALMFYGRYTMLVSIRKICSYSIFCWVFFIGQNIILLLLDACCMIIPLQSNDYYTFGYQHILNQSNIYIYTYTPLELITIVIISVSNPIILIELYKRWKRKCALQHASVLLIEMSMKLGAQHSHIELTKKSMKKASHQQQRIVLQVVVAVAIFSSYMLIYYLSFHIFAYNDKWIAVLHSVFYSITHISNPLIYFTCNKEIRRQSLTLFIQLWQYFLACNHTLLAGRYQLALHAIEPARSMRRLSVTESRKRMEQSKLATTTTTTTTVDMVLKLSSSITTDMDTLLNFKDDHEKQQQ